MREKKRNFLERIYDGGVLLYKIWRYAIIVRRRARRMWKAKEARWEGRCDSATIRQQVVRNTILEDKELDKRLRTVQCATGYSESQESQRYLDSLKDKVVGSVKSTSFEHGRELAKLHNFVANMEHKYQMARLESRMNYRELSAIDITRQYFSQTQNSAVGLEDWHYKQNRMEKERLKQAAEERNKMMSRMQELQTNKLNSHVGIQSHLGLHYIKPCRSYYE